MTLKKENDLDVKVLVTGADGMLGSNIVRELLGRGFEVHCFVEPHKKAESLSGLPVTIHRGSLCKPSDLIPAFKVCNYIIHTAGVTALWPARSEISWKINYDAVKVLVKLSRKYEIRRFIHIGTATSFGHGPIDKPGDEEAPYSNFKFKLDYQDSKYKAQEYLISEYKQTGFPVIILNPTFMLGKYDSGKGSNKMILYIYKQKAPGFSPGGKNYVHVKDVAVAAANALDRGRLGECYITGNMNLSYKDSFALIAEALDVSPPRLRLPRFLAVSFGALSSLVSTLTRKAPDVSYKMAKIGCEGCYYSSNKAVKELGMPQTPLDEAIRDSLDWFREQGMA